MTQVMEQQDDVGRAHPQADQRSSLIPNEVTRHRRQSMPGYLVWKANVWKERIVAQFIIRCKGISRPLAVEGRV